MKSLLFLLLSTVIGCAQVPSFKSFNPTQFSTNNFIISVKDGARVTNLISQSTSLVSFSQTPFALGGYYTNFFRTNLLTGDTDIFTVPAGYRMVGLLVYVSTTNTIGSTTYLGRLKTNSVTYDFLASQAISINGPASLALYNSYIFDENETGVVNSTRDGLNVFFSATMIPTTSGARSPKLLSLAVGENVLYSVPPGKEVVGITANSSDLRLGGIAGVIVNTSGAQRDYKTRLVPSGGITDPGTIYRAGPIGNNVSAPINLPYHLYTGSSIVIETDASTSTQWAYVTIVEFTP